MARFLARALLVMLLAAATACSVAGPATQGAGVVTRALTSEPPTLDPAGPAGSGQNVILPYLFDTLVYRDVDGSLKPFLAESWQMSADGKEFVFRLRSGVTFHDGAPLDAAAVVLTFERIKQQGAKSVLASGLTGLSAVEAVDARTVRFRLDAPSSVFLGTLSMPYAGIVSPAAVQKGEADFGQKPVGSGPFMLDSWESGVHVTLRRHEAYRWGPPAVKNRAAPLLSKIVFQIIPDAATQLAALQAGQVDMAYVNQPEQVQQLRKDPAFRVAETPMNSLVYIGFNASRPALADARVRRALSHMMNKDDIVSTALGGLGQAAYAPLSPTLDGFSPTLKQYEASYDPDKARALLGEAGFSQEAQGVWTKGAQKLGGVLLTSTRAPNGAIATMIQSQLAAVGVPLEIRQLDATAAMDAAAKGQYDLFLWRYDWNDANVLNIFLSSANIGRTNRTFYSNKALDDLLLRGVRETHDQVRESIYVEAQRIILEDAAWQPLYVPVDVTVVRSRVQNVVFGPMGRALLNDASVGAR